MNALQYTFALDPAFDMQAIRDRIATRQRLLAGTPGLHWKAWLLSEPLPDRPQAKSYAPLYLFDDAASTLSFLAGAVYRGVTDAFGWTLPHQGPAVAGHAAALREAQACSLRIVALGNHDELLAALASQGSNHPDAVAHCRLLDVGRMQLRDYRFWNLPAKDVPPAAGDVRYEVVATSFGTPTP